MNRFRKAVIINSLIVVLSLTLFSITPVLASEEPLPFKITSMVFQEKDKFWRVVFRGTEKIKTPDIEIRPIHATVYVRKGIEATGTDIHNEAREKLMEALKHGPLPSQSTIR